MFKESSGRRCASNELTDISNSLSRTHSFESRKYTLRSAGVRKAGRSKLYERGSSQEILYSMLRSSDPSDPHDRHRHAPAGLPYRMNADRQEGSAADAALPCPEHGPARVQ